MIWTRAAVMMHPGPAGLHVPRRGGSPHRRQSHTVVHGRRRRQESEGAIELTEGSG